MSLSLLALLSKLTALAEAQRLLTEAKDARIRASAFGVFGGGRPARRSDGFCYAELRLTRNRCHPKESGLPTTSIRAHQEAAVGECGA